MKHHRGLGTLLLFFICAQAAIAQHSTTQYLAEPPAAQPVVQPGTPQRADVNDVARFIAGLPPLGGGLLGELAKTSDWVNYAAAMDSQWHRFYLGRLKPISDWSAIELRHVPARTVLYPFSGPDFIFLQAYFPQATTYILCGLEPVGDPPSPEKLQPLYLTFGWLQASLKTLLGAGYFVTKDMRVDLKMSPLQGTLPILFVMLARSGDRITGVTYDAGHAEIRFVAPDDSRPRTLWYFSTDLSNGGLGKGSAFLNCVKQSHPDAAYFKAASYLPHEPDFSIIRNTVLSLCSAVVQDDSGIPLRSFDMRRWRLRLFGTYAPPLDIFAKYNQPDLAALYAKTPTKPLPFGTGYHWSRTSANLMIATADAPGSGPAQNVPPTSPSQRHR